MFTEYSVKSVQEEMNLKNLLFGGFLTSVIYIKERNRSSNQKNKKMKSDQTWK
jgi:hypothetical protein